MKARIATTDTAQTACGSKELEFPLPVSPSGGKPGRAGSPHAQNVPRPANTAGTCRARHSPHKRGSAPLCIPRPATRGSINFPVESIRTMDFNPNKLLPMSSE